MDLDGISILEDTPLPKAPENYKCMFDGILQNMNIAIDPSRSVSICGDSAYTGVAGK